MFRQVTRSLRAGGSRVDFVTDQYPEISIKGGERQRRADVRSGPLRTNVTRSNQPTPKQWRRFLSLGENKASLVRFFVKEWCSAEYTKNIPGTLYVAHGNFCTRIFASGEHRMHEIVSELECDHEEADTRLLLHCSHAVKSGYSKIIVESPDTDVAVLMCSHASFLNANLIFKTGTKHKTRYVNISGISQSFGTNFCNSLLGLHPITGCDSVSSFSGRGKKAFNLLCKSSCSRTAMGLLGNEFSPSDTLQRECEKFVCLLYGQKDGNYNVN